MTRLDELRKLEEGRKVSEQPVCTSDDKARDGVGNVMGDAVRDEPSKQDFSDQQRLVKVPEFLDAVDQIRDILGKLKEHLRAVEKLNKRALQAVGHEQTVLLDEGKARLARIEDQTRAVKAKLQAMEAENEELAVHKADAPQSYRLRIVNTASLRKSFAKLIDAHRRVQSKCDEVYKEDLRRQFLLIHPNATRMQIQAFMDDEPGARRSLFADSVRHGVQLECRAMQGRLQDMQALQRSVLELAALFTEIQQTVDEQQDLIDSVHSTLQNVQEETESAKKSLQSTDAYVRRKQRIKVIVVCVAVAVVLLIVSSVLFKFAPVLLLLRQPKVTVVNKQQK